MNEIKLYKIGSELHIWHTCEDTKVRCQSNHRIRQAGIVSGTNVVDTTGAGDCFYAGLIAGLVRGRNAEDAGRIAAAAGACSVTGVGAVSAMRDYDTLVRMAGLDA